MNQMSSEKKKKKTDQQQQQATVHSFHNNTKIEMFAISISRQ